MYKELMRKQVELEKELTIIIQQKWELNKQLKPIRKAIKEKELEDKTKKTLDILNDITNEELRI